MRMRLPKMLLEREVKSCAGLIAIGLARPAFLQGICALAADVEVAVALKNCALRTAICCA